MNKGCKKIFISTLLLSSTLGFNCAFGADSYKNSLLKVELLKKTDSAYSINLYTQKRYSEPVKVIKKSDYSYYILLPETKNSATKTSTPTSEIRNVSVNLHPYAGQDTTNGYTKINISTTRPINFELDVKQLSQSSTQKQTAIAKAEETAQPNNPVQNTSKEVVIKNLKTGQEETLAQNSQKKNSDSQDSKKITQSNTKTNIKQQNTNNTNVIKPIPKTAKTAPSPQVSKKTQTVAKAVQNTKKQEAPKANPIQKQINQPVQKTAQKPTQAIQPTTSPQQAHTAQPAQNSQSAPVPSNSKSLKLAVNQGESKPSTEVTTKINSNLEASASQNIDNDTDNLNNEIIDNETNDIQNENETSEHLSSNQTDTSTSNTADKTNKENKAKETFKQNLANIADKLQQNYKNILPQAKKIKTISAEKLALLGLSFGDFALILGSSLFTFLLILFLLTRKPSAPAKLRKREELLEEEIEETKQEKPNKGEFFVFDENVKQTRLQADNASKNYELSSFEPDITVNYKKEDNSFNSANEYEIIQKILKEDSSIEIEPPIKNEETKIEPEKQTQTPDFSNIITNSAIDDSDTDTFALNNNDFTKNSTNSDTAIIKNETSINNTYTNNLTDSQKTESFETLVKQAEAIKNSDKINEQTQAQRPKVLSSVEIAPERGFMCVSYNNNINLMGYIFDDVFALHNFKKEKLESYDIKFRLSDKDDKGANFIVKIDNSKMVIRATKLKMTKEVLM